MPAEPFGPWEWNDAKRCPATTLVRDDRMGGWVNRCMKAKGHRGHHRHVLSGCDPIAYMSWIGTHSDGSDAADEEHDEQHEDDEDQHPGD